MSIVLTGILAAPAGAQALTWLDQGPVLSPDPSIPFMSLSISSPTVFWDDVRGRFVMLFESRTPSTDPSCPAGIWAIGMATSVDGISWTPETAPILEPNPGSTTYWRCVAAHPTALYEEGGGVGGNGVIHLWFKAQQGTCPSPTPSWGCNDAVGIGKASVVLNAAGDVQNVLVRATPVWVSPSATVPFGYPKMIQRGNRWVAFMQVYPDIHSATGTLFNARWTLTPEILLADAQATMTWADDELLNPSTVCDDDIYGNGAIFLGGRNTSGPSVIDAAWSKVGYTVGAVDPYDLTGPAEQTWQNNEEWRHWDHHKLSTADDQYVVWYGEKDPATGNNWIGLAGTTLTFTGQDLVPKVCP